MSRSSLVSNKLSNRVNSKCDVKEIQICEIMGLVGILTGLACTLKVKDMKILEIAVGAGKSLNSGTNFIQPRFSGS